MIGVPKHTAGDNPNHADRVMLRAADQSMLADTSVCRSRPVGAEAEVGGVPPPDGDPKTNVREITMWFGLGIIGVIIWIAIAFWPARVAGRKGHSFIGYFLLSLLFFPLALILAYAVEDRTRVAYG
jgi:hypothetical protein